MHETPEGANPDGTDAAEPRKGTLHLEAIAGPPLDTILVEPETPIVLGRSSAADRQLADKTVSRRHCRIQRRGQNWLLTDLGSRHGTFLGGMRLEPDQPKPVNNGDLVRVGPWTLRVIDDADRSTSMPTTNDLATTSHRVQRVPVRELRSVAQQRLDLLIECAAGINAATGEGELGERALAAVTEGTGFRRAAFIRQVSAAGDVEVIASSRPDEGTRVGSEHDDVAPFAFSRSLINAASNGEIVRMTADSKPNYGESIIRLGIQSALCAPIMLGQSVEAYLYLDARENDEPVAADAAAFCQAISRMCGLALANLKRIELEKKSARMADEVRAAREAQVRLMPRALDTVHGFEYAMQTKPGSTLAGDLFDAVALPGDRLAVFLGDVIGKGIGAAILMATVQAELRTALSRGAAPDEAVSSLNRSLCVRSADGEFVSLWLGVFDRARGHVEFVDAGHGLWLCVSPGERARRIDCEGGTLVGVDETAAYVAETVPFPAGSRLLVFSDGLVEQRSPENEMFGFDRCVEAIKPGAAPREDVVALTRALREHADTDAFSDDLTVASIAYAR